MKYIILFLALVSAAYSQGVDSTSVTRPLRAKHYPEIRRTAYLVDTVYGINGELITPAPGGGELTIDVLTDSLDGNPRNGTVVINGVTGSEFTLPTIGMDDSLRWSPEQISLLRDSLQHLRDSIAAHRAALDGLGGGSAVDSSYYINTGNRAVLLPLRIPKMWVHLPGTGNVVAMNAIVPTVTATGLDSTDEATSWHVARTSTAKNNASGWSAVINTGAQVALGWEPDVVFKVKTSPLQSQWDSAGYRFGLYGTALSPDSTTPYQQLAEFRYINGWDTGSMWRCVTQRAPYQRDTTVTSVPLAGNTVYYFRIRVRANVIYFYIDNVLVATHNTAANMPALGTVLAPCARVLNRRLGWATNPTAPKGTCQVLISHVYIEHN